MSAAPQLEAPRLLVPDFTPDHIIGLDFESYWDEHYTLKKLTTSDYVKDGRFETIGVAVDDGEDATWMEADEFRRFAREVNWAKSAVLAHHAHFECLILKHHYDVVPAFIFDTLSMANGWGIDGGVGLENLGVKLGIGVKGKEILETKGKRRKDFTPEEYTRFGAYSLNDLYLCRGIFNELLAQGFPEPELWIIDGIVRMFSEPRFRTDEQLLHQYLIDERAKKAHLLERIQRDRSIVLSGDKFADELRAIGVEPPTKVSPKTKKTIYAFAKTDPGMQELLESDDDEVRWLAEARIAVKSTINETRAERFLRMGRFQQPLNVYLKYYGAHTGRVSASDRTNFLNLQRANKKKPERGMLRKSLVAQKGKKVVSGDSSTIEARITGWLAGHDDLTAAFREKKDVYSAFASEVYQRPVDRKRNPEDEVPGQIAKVCVLGLGYSMGWPKLAEGFLRGTSGDPLTFTVEMADQMGVDLSKFWNDAAKVERATSIVSRLSQEQLLVHCAVCEHLVRRWRGLNRPIVELWHTMESVLEVMLEDNADYTFGPGNCVVAQRHGILLPNGMRLRYPGLKYSEEESLGGDVGFSYLGKYGKVRQRIYGGAATENLVQALARIVVTEQMNHVRAVTGYTPVTFPYDELAYIVPESEAEDFARLLRETMHTTPSWAPGLPIAAEVGFHQSYGLVEKR